VATAEPAAAAAYAELVGRRSECELLETLVADAAAGHSRTLVVRGEPGIGKSTMVD
jgi:predicted ATPase